MSFSHLHTHSAYSLLDGEGTIKKILNRAKELGQTSMALTDHGNMFGIIEFYEYAKSIGIKPVLGCEVYVAARTRFDKMHEYDATSSHLILLAKNNEGYKNLMKIVSIGYVDGFYYRPRIDMQTLKENSNGIIALSACMSGVLSRQILNSNIEGAKQSAKQFIDIFGKENYYIELQDHGIYEQKRLNSELISIAKEFDLGLVATNDIHYVSKKDAEYQDVLMCIQMGKTVNDTDRMKMSVNELYVKSDDEMKELFSYIPEAIENTQKIADKCNVDIEFGKLHLPKFDLPDGYTSEEYLLELCEKGFKKRYPEDDGTVRKQLEYELSIIKHMGYVDYFLIVWDFIHFSKTNNIMVGPGRGSAAGSVVSYCLEITNIDPIKFDLFFERFLNPERVTMPDIDVDFCYERRSEVIDYVNRKYGSDHVAQIVTFGTMAARLAIRDVGRVLDIPYATVDTVAKQIPNELHVTIESALKENKQLKEMYDADPIVKKLIDTASELEGLPRHTSTHAAGVVITRDPVLTYVPLQRNDEVITTQFTMTTIERLGLLKMDFLGLRTLTVIRDCIRNIKQEKNVTIDIDNIDMNDSGVYNMISNGDTSGVFQLESGGMQAFMKELRPTSIEDIIAGISLYRPGPMDSIPKYISNKNDPAHIEYKHPLLKNILDVTYGCIVYQEQVMQIVRELGGYSLGRADLVRRAMSKKKADVMEQEKKNFIYGVKDESGKYIVEGAIKRGIDEKIATEIFDEMMDFARYAFNKSHAAAYGFVSYQTAWLKYHYPTEYFAALLTSVLGNSTSVTKYINSVKKLGIKILPPDINKSLSTFVPDNGNIRFGLAAVKNVGSSLIDEMYNERKKNGHFTSFRNFCSRMAASKINKRLIESLIKSGAFDSLKLKRSVLLSVYENVIDSVIKGQKSLIEGQFNLFDSFEELSNEKDDFPDFDELPEKDLLNMEKEYIGVYVSGHPLDRFKEQIKKISGNNILEIIENDNARFTIGSRVRVAGIISKIRTQLTKKGELMMYLNFEDLTGEIEVIVFPSLVRKYTNLLFENSTIIITGNLDMQEDKPSKIRVEGVAPLSENLCPYKKMYLKVDSSSSDNFSKIKLILKDSNGDISVNIYCDDNKKTLIAPKSMWVSNNNFHLDELKELLGEDSVKLI